MEAWELGHKAVAPQNVSLGTASTGPASPASNTTRSNTASRPVAQIDPLGNRTTFGYDAAGNEIKQKKKQ
jgi:YD repeat-containing protein